jgi:hypothetical protein
MTLLPGLLELQVLRSQRLYTRQALGSGHRHEDEGIAQPVRRTWRRRVQPEVRPLDVPSSHRLGRPHSFRHRHPGCHDGRKHRGRDLDAVQAPELMLVAARGVPGLRRQAHQRVQVGRRLGRQDARSGLRRCQGRAVQVDSIKPRVESAYGFSA